MSEPHDQLVLSEELLALVRRAAQLARELREPFISPYALLLALLEEPGIGPAIARVVNREKLAKLEPPDVDAPARVSDSRLGDELPPMVRYDTLAFKTPDGGATLWLSREGLQIFIEGAQRAEGRYEPKHLALGFAAEAVRAPGVLAALRVEPGVLADAVYKL